MDVIWKLMDTMPGYYERELYREYIRDLQRNEVEEAVKRLHNDLKMWDKEKMESMTTAQQLTMARAWKQRDEDIRQERNRPLEEEGEHAEYPISGMTKYMNLMRELKVVETEREEARAGGATHAEKKGEEGRKGEEEEQEEKGETAPPSEEKEDGREENTKKGQTTLSNDGRTELNEKGKEESIRLAKNTQRKREEEEKAIREEHRRHEKEKRRIERMKKDESDAIISQDQQIPREQNQIFILKTDRTEIHGLTLKSVIEQANKHDRYITNELAKPESHRKAEKIGLTKGFPEGRSITIIRLPDKRVTETQDDKTRIFWEDNLPSTIGTRTILTLTDSPTKITHIPTKGRYDQDDINRHLKKQHRESLNHITTTSRYWTDIETTLQTDVRVERGMILTELGGWVLIDKHENENARISMNILEHETYHGEFPGEQARTGRKYTTDLTRLEETTDDHIQQEIDATMNAGTNALATRLHQDEEETWYVPRTEDEEDQLIQQERTQRIKDPFAALWVDKAFDMGISFSDIFRRINKVNHDFWVNYHRGPWINREQYYETHVKGKTPITKQGGEHRRNREMFEYRAGQQDDIIVDMCKQMITERLTGITMAQHARELEMLNGKEDITHPWLNRPINHEDARQINELIKTLDRKHVSLDDVIEEATGVDQKLWNLTDNLHIPSKYWSFKGKERVQTKSKEEEEEGEKEEEKKGKEGEEEEALRPQERFRATKTKSVIAQLKRILEIDQRHREEHKRKEEKDIAEAIAQSRIKAYEGRPYSEEHNEIPEPDPIERERGRIPHMQETEERREEEEERDIEDENVEEGRRLETEWKIERDRKLEDSMDMEEVDKSPKFQIISRASVRIQEYDRQSISIDPENFIEVMKEKIRQHQRGEAGAGCPHPERLHKLEELGCGEQSKSWTGIRWQLSWYCAEPDIARSETRSAEEYLNTHNEGEEALEQMDKLGVAYSLWAAEVHDKTEEWWNRFGDETNHHNQILRLIHRLAKIRKLVRERTRDNQKLVNIYQQILQQADITIYAHSTRATLLPISKALSDTIDVDADYKTIQEKEDEYEDVGPEAFDMKVQEEALKWAEGSWIKTSEHAGKGDIKTGREGSHNPLTGDNEVKYVKKFMLTKRMEGETHEWTMIELWKKDKSREQNVYKTKGPDITKENIQFPILRSLGGEKMDEMGKRWEMIFELNWEREYIGTAEGVRKYGPLRGTKKNDGLKVDDWVRKIYNNEVQQVAKEHYMGVTPRGVDYEEWEDYSKYATMGRITIVLSRVIQADTNKTQRDTTNEKERAARDNILIDTVTKDGHPILNDMRTVYKQLEKGETGYGYRERHETLPDRSKPRVLPTHKLPGKLVRANELRIL